MIRFITPFRFRIPWINYLIVIYVELEYNNLYSNLYANASLIYKLAEKKLDKKR